MIQKLCHPVEAIQRLDAAAESPLESVACRGCWRHHLDAGSYCSSFFSKIRSLLIEHGCNACSYTAGTSLRNHD
jgi:hypothetical protein